MNSDGWLFLEPLVFNFNIKQIGQALLPFCTFFSDKKGKSDQPKAFFWINKKLLDQIECGSKSLKLILICKSSKWRRQYPN